MKMRDRENLLGLLEQKKELLTKMRDVTKQFGTWLENDDVDTFVDGLQQREEIIKKIDAFTRIERQMPEVDDEQARLLKEQSRGIIQEILNIDEQNAALAKNKIDQYKVQIRSLNHQKKGIGQYERANKMNEAFYFDEKK